MCWPPACVRTSATRNASDSVDGGSSGRAWARCERIDLCAHRRTLRGILLALALAHRRVNHEQRRRQRAAAAAPSAATDEANARRATIWRQTPPLPHLSNVGS